MAGGHVTDVIRQMWDMAGTLRLGAGSPHGSIFNGLGVGYSALSSPSFRRFSQSLTLDEPVDETSMYIEHDDGKMIVAVPNCRESRSSQSGSSWAGIQPIGDN